MKRSIERLTERDGPNCHWCGRETLYPAPEFLNERIPRRYEQHPLSRTRDHLIPRSQGGTNRLSNLVIACYECNQARGDLGAHYWASLQKEKEHG